SDRPDRWRVGAPGARDPRGERGWPPRRAPAPRDRKRHPLRAAQREGLALGPARPATGADALSLLPALAPGRHLGQGARGAAETRWVPYSLGPVTPIGPRRRWGAEPTGSRRRRTAIRRASASVCGKRS